MEVEVLQATENPERLVCQAARGDYYSGYVGDTEYAELMKDVDSKDHHLQEELVDCNYTARSSMTWDDYEDSKLSYDSRPVVNARTRSFIEKQLSRGHYGPWEHPQITFAVKGVSRVTMAQITRHRHMTFDVQSMRYADFSEKEDNVAMPRSLEDPDHFTRETGAVDIDETGRRWLKAKYDDYVENAFHLYESMVDNGVPKEDARFILPLGTTVNMTFSGNVRTFLHLLDMRRKANAQWEIRELSEKLLDELFDWCPYTFNYYEEHGPNKLSP